MSLETPENIESSLTDKDKTMLETADTRENAEIIILPEQIKSLDAKREHLASGGDFAFRFASSKEYYNLLASGITPRLLEANTEVIQQFAGEQIQHARSHNGPGDGAEIWRDIAHSYTSWPQSSEALGGQHTEFLLYKRFCRSEEEMDYKTEARIKFSVMILTSVAEYLAQIYNQRKLGRNRLAGEEANLNFELFADLLQEPNDLILDEHRQRLESLFRKDVGELDRSDIRFLMRFSKGSRIYTHRPSDSDTISGGSQLPYELLEIWDAGESSAELNPWKLTHDFTSIKKGTSLEHLLAVVAITPSDKEYIHELSQRMLKASQDSPELAHLIVNPKMYEEFPNKGTDLLPQHE